MQVWAEIRPGREILQGSQLCERRENAGCASGPPLPRTPCQRGTLLPLQDFP